MFQIIFSLVVFMALIMPLSVYLYHIATNQRTFADPVFNRIDNVIYKVCGVDLKEMNWKQYIVALLLTNTVMILLGYLILRIQSIGFFNPNGIGGMEETLSFNTIISFMTNTNLQHYSGESGLSYMSQMLVITFMMFSSAASGYAIAMAFARNMSGLKKTCGNFYEDLIRITTRVLLPISLIVALFIIQQGVPQNFDANKTFTTIEGTVQELASGPVAALESIKHVGTNGGGYLGANSSTPIENPTALSNLAEMWSMMILPGAIVLSFGLMMRKKNSEGKWIKSKQGWVIFGAMAILFLIGLITCVWAERSGNPIFTQLGLVGGNMEGKEVRFGLDLSALFTTVTTSFTTGTVNNMHDSLTPIGGMVPMILMMLNSVFGGKGVGFMNMMMMAILTVFICGLMVGRTPEFLRKKIEGREIKLITIVILCHPLLILAFSALATATASGVAGITNPGYHGLSQILYEFSSAAANNGSGFEGLADNTPFWNMTTGIVMYYGRYLSMVLLLAISSSLAHKKAVNESIGTLRTDNFMFTILLVFVVLIVGALTFLPALALGPVAEHLTLWF